MIKYIPSIALTVCAVLAAIINRDISASIYLVGAGLCFSLAQLTKKVAKL